MIIDADTHILPKDAFDYIEGLHDSMRPRYWFNKDGLFERMEFPGEPRLSGVSPIRPPGTGSKYKGMSNIEERLGDYRRMGVGAGRKLISF